jgi:hypothetical protein
MRIRGGGIFPAMVIGCDSTWRRKECGNRRPPPKNVYSLSYLLTFRLSLDFFKQPAATKNIK